MKLEIFEQSSTKEVVELFVDVFSAAESESEGALIGNLVTELISTTDVNDLVGCIAVIDSRIVGCIFFSRFIVPSGELAFILSPVAVSTRVQGRGIGQKLIRYGLDYLKSLEVRLVCTYGDPAFYSKVGFAQIAESILEAPFTLSQPEGWLAQSLDEVSIKAMPGKTKCVVALSDPQYW